MRCGSRLRPAGGFRDRLQHPTTAPSAFPRSRTTSSKDRDERPNHFSTRPEPRATQDRPPLAKDADTRPHGSRGMGDTAVRSSDGRARGGRSRTVTFHDVGLRSRQLPRFADGRQGDCFGSSLRPRTEFDPGAGRRGDSSPWLDDRPPRGPVRQSALHDPQPLLQHACQPRASGRERVPEDGGGQRAPRGRRRRGDNDARQLARSARRGLVRVHGNAGLLLRGLV